MQAETQNFELRTLNFELWYSPRSVHRRLPVLALALMLAATVDAAAQTLDSFNVGFPAVNPGSTISAVAVQPDHKILIGGTFTQLGVGCGSQSCPMGRQKIARLHPDGSLDLSFNPGADNMVMAIAVQPDGKILVGGAFTLIGGGGSGSTARPGIARLNADGSVDTAFIGGATGWVRAIYVQPDGKVIVGGLFSALGAGPGAVARSNIGRFNQDGTVDLLFNPGANGDIGQVVAQPDGRLLVGGRFSMIGGGGTGTVARVGLARLQPNGMPDAFDANMAGAFFNVMSIAIQPDGRIIVGGQFETFGGVTRYGLARLTASGALDLSLDADLGHPSFPEDSAVLSLALQTDGRIVFGGQFNSMNGLERLSLARRQADGSADPVFATSALGTSVGNPANVTALALDTEGHLIAGGNFNSINFGAVRNLLARFTNTQAATQELTVSGDGSTVLWMREGTSPEVDRVTFESTLDGQTWALLGEGIRIPDGWLLGDLTIPAAAVVRARGFVGGSIYESVHLPPTVNRITNGSFDSGLSSWFAFATPDLSHITVAINNGVLEFSRAPAPPGGNQAVVVQQTNIPVPAFTRLQAQFDLGNSDSVRKRMTVLVHDAAFGDLTMCSFWLQPNAPLRTYQFVLQTTQYWKNATISFYAATPGTGGSYRVDNVSLRPAPGGVAGEETLCIDPTAPVPVAQGDGPSLLINGDFASGSITPGWGLFGQITGAVTAGVFEFVRPPGTPAGVILQPTGVPLDLGDAITATFQLGNNSPIRKRVTVIVHDRNFSDLAACAIWLGAGQPLTDYTLRAFASKDWTDATLSVYSATIGPEAYIRLDNATLRRTPSATVLGTECLNNGPPFEAPPAGTGRVTRAPRVPLAAQGSVRAGRLDRAQPIEVPFGWLALMSLQLPQSAAGEHVLVQVSHDGMTWKTIRVVAPGEGEFVAVDLTAYSGQTILLRLVRRQ